MCFCLCPIWNFCCQSWSTCENKTDLDEKRIFHYKLPKKLSEAHRNISILKIQLYDTDNWAIVSQLSKCLKFMTFREGCFVIRNWMQVLKWSSWDFLSLLILQKIKENNISQLGDYDAPFCEQQYTHGSCYMSLFKLKSFDQLIPPPPKLPQILDIYSVVAL